jgi:surface antigen
MSGWIGGQMAALGAAFALAAPFSAQPAQAYQHSHHASHLMSGRDAARVIYAGASHYGRYRSSFRGGFAGGTLQCVPFARENTGIELTGNAVNWWDNAAGIYERGARPEVGSILNFRGTRRMHLGHVAVVSNVVDSRTVQIDHANWSGRGVVTRNVTVVDASPDNDWSAVRVTMGNGEFGSVYPTYGFIYDRPDKGVMLANAGISRSNAPIAQSVPITLGASALSRGTLDLRLPTDQAPIVLAPQQDQEVAEADDVGTYHAHRSGARAMPVVRYGRAAMHFAHYGYAGARSLRRGEMMLAQLGRGTDRMTSGRMMGNQVLFMGHIAQRGGRDMTYAGGHGAYSGTVRQIAARPRTGHVQSHATATQPGHIRR